MTSTPADSNGEAESGADSDAPPEPTENALLSGGAGEENEATLYEARAKLWRHESKEEGGKKEFVEHGISIVRLKKPKDGNGKPRMLARSDANGHVQIVSLSS